jgi:hypothetical protein
LVDEQFPLEPIDAAAAQRWLESEAAAAQALAGRTRFPTPEPIGLGQPGAGYPLPWSVQTWLPGVTATDADPSDSITFAHDLADLIQAVRAIDTPRPDLQRPGSRRAATRARRLDADLFPAALHRGGRYVMISPATTWSGNAAGRGPFSRQWDWSGATSTATRR